VRCDMDQVSLHYDCFGQGIPLLALHGMPLDRSATIYEFEPVLSKRKGWKRIYVDLPGHGESPKAPWPPSDDRVIDVLVDFVDATLGDSDLVVAGTSYGGMIARGLVDRMADRIDGLCLLVAPMKPRDERVVPDHVVLADADEIGRAAEQSTMVGHMAVAWPESARRYWDAIAKTIVDEDYLDGYVDYGKINEVLQRHRAPLASPTLIIAGRQDNVSGYRDAWDVLELYPRATFAVLDRAGHPLRGEQEPLFVALVEEWLDRVEEWISQRASRSS
jgi:pimeloyl-ACP methyl ester carboxylesterase